MKCFWWLYTVSWLVSSATSAPVDDIDHDRGYTERSEPATKIWLIKSKSQGLVRMQVVCVERVTLPYQCRSTWNVRCSRTVSAARKRSSCWTYADTPRIKSSSAVWPLSRMSPLTVNTAVLRDANTFIKVVFPAPLSSDNRTKTMISLLIWHMNTYHPGGSWNGILCS